MAKYLGRIGAKKQVFSFDISVHWLQLHLTQPVKVNIIWKRSKLYLGKKRIETKNHYSLSPSSGSVEINETLTMINTLYLDKKDKYLKKKAVITVQAVIDQKSRKKVGHLTLNLAECLDKPLCEKELNLEGCPDKKAKVCISTGAQALGEAQVADNISEASGTVSMGTEDDYQGQLFSEQDLSEFEDTKTQVVPGTKGRPPMLKKVKEDNQVKELQAQVSLLEKENESLKAEKQESQVELGVVYEQIKKERNSHSETVKNLKEKLTTYQKESKNWSDKYTRKAQKLQLLQDQKTQLETKLKNTQDNQTTSEQLKQELQETQDNYLKFSQQCEALQQENDSLHDSLTHMQNQNSKLRNDISSLRKELEQLRSTPRSLEKDSAFNRYKQQTEALINNLKKDIANRENEKEHLLQKNTDLQTTLKKSKAELRDCEESYKEMVSSLECEVQCVKQENTELKSELEKSKDFQETSNSDKVANLKEKNNNLKKEIDELQKALNDYENKQYDKENIQHSVSKQQLLNQIQKLESRVNRYKKELGSKNTEIHEMFTLKCNLESENSTLKDQLKKATNSEFSDPANAVLQEQIQSFENYISQLQENHSSEKTQLKDQVSILEHQLEILESKKNQSTDHLEKQLNKLQVENKMLKQQVKELQNEFEEQEDSNLQSMEQQNLRQCIEMLQTENKDLKLKLDKLQKTNKETEQKYVDSKMGWANSDLEKENLKSKYKDAQEQIREYSVQYTQMEVELYKINERFGQTLNYTNELELEIQNLRNQLCKNCKKSN